MSPLAYNDYTIKARLHNLQAMQNRLQQEGARYEGLDQQTDRYYQVTRSKLKWRAGTIENLITHYERIREGGQERTRVYRYDRHPDAAAIAALQQSHRELGMVRKQRHIYHLHPVKIHLDVLEGGEQFIELEAIDRSGIKPLAELRAQCESIRQRLGIPEADLLPTGYFNC